MSFNTPTFQLFNRFSTTLRFWKKLSIKNTLKFVYGSKLSFCLNFNFSKNTV